MAEPPLVPAFVTVNLLPFYDSVTHMYIMLILFSVAVIKFRPKAIWGELSSKAQCAEPKLGHTSTLGLQRQELTGYEGKFWRKENEKSQDSRMENI